MQKNILFQFGIILIITYLGNFLASLIPFPLPGVVLGLILLFLILYFNLLKLSSVQDITKMLLGNMAFLFIPAGVNIINSLDLLSSYWWKILLVVLISTIVTMIVTAWVVQYSIYYFRRKNRQDK